MRTLSTNVTYGKLGNSKRIWLLEVESATTTYRWATRDCNSTDVPNWTGNTFDGGRLAQGGLGRISQEIDLTEGGAAAKISGFNFSLRNEDAYAQGTLFVESGSSEYFENRRVELRLIFKETWILYDGQLGGESFAVGNTVVGGTSGATAIILQVIDSGSIGALRLGLITGATPVYSDNEELRVGGVRKGYANSTQSNPSWTNAVPVFFGYTSDVQWDREQIKFSCMADWLSKHRSVPTKIFNLSETPTLDRNLEGKYAGLVYGDFQAEQLNKKGIGYRYSTVDTDCWAHRDYIAGKLLAPINKYGASGVEPYGILALAEHELKASELPPLDDNTQKIYRWNDDVEGFIQAGIYNNYGFDYEAFGGYDRNLLASNLNDLFIQYMLVPSFDSARSGAAISGPNNCCDEDSTNDALITASGQDFYYVFPALETSETLAWGYIQINCERTGDDTLSYVVSATGESPNVTGSITTWGISGSHIIDISAWGTDGLQKAVTLKLTSGTGAGAFETIKIKNISIVATKPVDFIGSPSTKCCQSVQGRMFNKWIDSESHSGAPVLLVPGALIESPVYIAESLLCDECSLTTYNVGTCAEFNHTGSYKKHLKITHGDSLDFTSSDITICCWVYVYAYMGGHNGILFKTSDPINRKAEPIEYYINSAGKPCFDLGNGSAVSTLTGTNVVGLGASVGWVHLAVIYNPTTDMCIHYRNGVINGTTGMTANTLDLEGYLYIGRGWGTDTTANHFNGCIDELKVYRRVLSGAEITADYAAGVGKYGTRNETDLVLGFHFDEGQGRHCDDFSGGEHHAGAIGTLTGRMPAWINGKVKTPTSQVVESSFDSLATLKDGWLCARQIDKSNGTIKLIEEICFEGGFAYLQNYDGRDKVIRITDSTPTKTITSPDILAFDGVPSISVSHLPVKEMRNEFFLYYQENYATGNYDRVAFISNPDASRYDSKYQNLDVSGDGPDYWAFCHSAYTKFKQVNRWEYKAKWIRQRSTAELFLKFMIRWLTHGYVSGQDHLASRTYRVDLKTPLKNIDFELCDQAYITHSLLPAGVTTVAPFILTKFALDPNTDILDFQWTQTVEEVA